MLRHWNVPTQSDKQEDEEMSKMVPDGYFCSACNKKVPEEEVRVVGHSIGNMHDDGKCMSGRVTTVWREIQEKD